MPAKSKNRAVRQENVRKKLCGCSLDLLFFRPSNGSVTFNCARFLSSYIRRHEEAVKVTDSQRKKETAGGGSGYKVHHSYPTNPIPSNHSIPSVAVNCHSLLRIHPCSKTDDIVELSFRLQFLRAQSNRHPHIKEKAKETHEWEL